MTKAVAIITIRKENRRHTNQITINKEEVVATTNSITITTSRTTKVVVVEAAVNGEIIILIKSNLLITAVVAHSQHFQSVSSPNLSQLRTYKWRGNS